jgi:hypothetical protein
MWYVYTVAAVIVIIATAAYLLGRQNNNPVISANIRYKYLFAFAFSFVLGVSISPIAVAVFFLVVSAYFGMRYFRITWLGRRGGRRFSLMQLMIFVTLFAIGLGFNSAFQVWFFTPRPHVSDPAPIGSPRQLFKTFGQPT